VQKYIFRRKFAVQMKIFRRKMRFSNLQSNGLFVILFFWKQIANYEGNKSRQYDFN